MLEEVCYYIKQLDDLINNEREDVLAYLDIHKDEIDIDVEFVEGFDYPAPYHTYTIEGPGFYMSFDVGCDTDYLSLNELESSLF